MSFRILLFSALLIFLLFAYASCGNNPVPGQKQEAEKLVDTFPSADHDRTTIQVPEESDSSNVKSARNETSDERPPNYSSLPGPIGFVNEDNLVLREKPNMKSNKIATLKIKESIYILETSMLSDNGDLNEYPTWYRIERKNKERGWVKAAAVSSGH